MSARLQLTLRRDPKPTYTPGALYVAQGFQCHTLEDPERADPIPSTPANEAKVYGDTAIPRGTYDVVINWSPKFQRLMPEVLNVPGFTGIRIHPGNEKRDTSGCILVGSGRREDRLMDSRGAFELLFEKISAAKASGLRVVLTIE